MRVLQRIVHTALANLAQAVIERLQILNLSVRDRKDGVRGVLIERVGDFNLPPSLCVGRPDSVDAVGNVVRAVNSQSLRIDSTP